MTTWRDELLEAIKTRAERDAEEEAKRKKRLEEALKIADEASEKAHEGLAFTHDHLVAKGLSPTLTRDGNAATLEFCGQTLTVDLDRSEAMLKVAAKRSLSLESFDCNCASYCEASTAITVLGAVNSPSVPPAEALLLSAGIVDALCCIDSSAAAAGTAGHLRDGTTRNVGCKACRRR